MRKSVHFRRYLGWVLLANGAFALPLCAEEITVTVPPDPPAQAAAQPAPASTSGLPAFTAGDHLGTAVATDEKAPAQAQGDAGSQSSPAAADANKHEAKKTIKPASKPGAGEDASAEAGTASAPQPATAEDATKAAEKPKDKPKQAAASPCKGLGEAACNANKLCKWVIPTDPTPIASGKAPTARCRSLAILKKEAAKAAKAAEHEVLPWAPKPAAPTSTSSTSPGSDPGTASGTTAEAAAKTAAVKKASKSKDVAPVVPADSGNTQDTQPPADAPPSDPQ